MLSCTPLLFTTLNVDMSALLRVLSLPLSTYLSRLPPKKNPNTPTLPRSPPSFSRCRS